MPPPTDRRDVMAYLVWLADQPGGIPHRDWLFHAVRLIERDVSVTLTCATCRGAKGVDAVTVAALL